MDAQLHRSHTHMPDMLNASDYAVLSLVYEYLQQTSKRTVTYDSLVAYAKKYKKTEYKSETIQRCMRKLAEHGFFERKYVTSYTTNKRIVIYIPTQKFNEFFKSVKQ
ncbi:MAG: hypothetical protein QW794_04505 [Thermosphaera sp.]